LPPSSAVAYIEMKSSFNASSFSKAIDAILNTQNCLSGIDIDIWRCICFASVDRTFDSFLETVCQKIKESIAKINVNSSPEVMKKLPMCIASFESYIVFIRANEADNSIVLNFFDFGKLSISIAFSDLFEHIREHFGIIGNGELSEIVMHLPNNNYIQQILNINDK